MKSRIVPVLLLILFISFSSFAWAEDVTDNFNDNAIDTSLWSPDGDEHLYATEENGRLEIKADGTLNNSAGYKLTGRYLSVDEDFRIQVDFNSGECSQDCILFFGIHNVTTDLDHFDEYILFGNGFDSYSGIVNRSWIAAKNIDDNFVDLQSEVTAQNSGTLFVEYTNGVFYVSATNFGVQNALATFSIEDWTSCSQLYVGLWVWSGNQDLSGDGSYFDNFVMSVNTIPGNSKPWLPLLLFDE